MQIRSYLLAGAALFALSACGTADHEAAWEGSSKREARAEAHAGERAELLRAADEAWEQRDDAEKTLEAIRGYRAAVEIDPNDVETLTKLSHAEYYHADCHLSFDEEDEDAYKEMLQHATKSAEYALLALSPEFANRMRNGWRMDEAVSVLDKTAVPALYWRSSALGKWATAEGFATLLSYKDEVKAIMERCLDLDQSFYYYGPDRYFGVFYGRAPAMSGGDLNKSRQHFDLSLEKAPNYFATRVLMADDYAVKAQDKELYRELLEAVINGDPESLPEAAPENRCEQRKAKILLDQIEDRFE